MQVATIVNPNKRERRGVRYVHVFGNDFFDLYQYNMFPFASEILDQIHHAKQNYGGYTIRVDHEVQNMSIALCSFKDQFSRPRGREMTDGRAGLVGIAGTFCVLTPDVLLDSVMETVRLAAVYHCLQLWMAFDWPIEFFKVNRIVATLDPDAGRYKATYPSPGVVFDVQEGDGNTGAVVEETPGD